MKELLEIYGKGVSIEVSITTDSKYYNRYQLLKQMLERINDIIDSTNNIDAHAVIVKTMLKQLDKTIKKSFALYYTKSYVLTAIVKNTVVYLHKVITSEDKVVMLYEVAYKSQHIDDDVVRYITIVFDDVHYLSNYFADELYIIKINGYVHIIGSNIYTMTRKEFEQIIDTCKKERLKLYEDLLILLSI